MTRETAKKHVLSEELEERRFKTCPGARKGSQPLARNAVCLSFSPLALRVILTQALLALKPWFPFLSVFRDHCCTSVIMNLTGCLSCHCFSFSCINESSDLLLGGPYLKFKWCFLYPAQGFEFLFSSSEGWVMALDVTFCSFKYVPLELLNDGSVWLVDRFTNIPRAT